MRIAIDADRAWANRFGIGRFVREAIQALQEGLPQNEYLLLTLTRRNLPIRSAYSPVRLLRGLRRLFWLHYSIPRQLWRWKADVLFSPDYLSATRLSCPRVVVVHDLLALKYPQWGERLVNWQLRMLLPRAVSRAEAVVVPSQWIRQELLQALHLDPGRVHVVEEGVGEQFQPMTKEQRLPVLSQYGLAGDPYMLSVGMWTPRKNLLRILQAFKQIQPAFGGKLVMVGAGSWNRQSIFKEISRLNLQKHVVAPGFVGDEQLCALYGGASCFVFPSLYEGFGLPVLEAMACGCPVITSRTSALPEVAGEAAVLVDPWSIAEIASAMRRLASDPGLQQDCRQRGFERARIFSWTKTAEKLGNVFGKVAGNGGNC